MLTINIVTDYILTILSGQLKNYKLSANYFIIQKDASAETSCHILYLTVLRVDFLESDNLQNQQL